MGKVPVCWLTANFRRIRQKEGLPIIGIEIPFIGRNEHLIGLENVF